MKIKLSKSQWEGIGKKAGWIKVALYENWNLDENERAELFNFLNIAKSAHKDAYELVFSIVKNNIIPDQCSLKFQELIQSLEQLKKFNGKVIGQSFGEEVCLYFSFKSFIKRLNSLILACQSSDVKIVKEKAFEAMKMFQTVSNDLQRAGLSRKRTEK